MKKSIDPTFDEKKESFEMLTELYDSLGDQREDFRNGNLVFYLLQFFRKGPILDIGCGTGFLLRSLALKGFVTLEGVEPNKKIGDQLTKAFPNIHLHRIWAEHVDTIKKKFLTISMIDVLEHIKDDHTMSRQVYDRLLPGGRFIIVVPAHSWLYGKRDKKAGHYRRYSKKRLVNTIKDAGFVIRSVRYWNMAGVLPYWFSEKVMKKELQTSLRSTKKTSLPKKIVSRLLHRWFRHVENNASFGVGLSLILIAEKNSDT